MSKVSKDIHSQHMADFLSDLRLLLNTKYTGIFRISGMNLLAVNLFRLLKDDIGTINDSHKYVSITQGKHLENIIVFTLPATAAARAIQLALSEELDFFGETKDSQIILTSPPRKFHESF
jgi:hypothetical protein